MRGEQPKTLADFVGPSRESGEQIVFMACPVCGCQRFKTYVNPVTGFWFCHSAQHAGGGRVDVGTVLAGRGNLVLQQLSQAPSHGNKWPEMSMPRWTPLGWRAVRYLERRGIDKAQAAALGIVEMEEHMRVVVPYRYRNGSIIYWNARSYSDLEEGPKYLAASGKHPLYVLPQYKEADTLVLVEGVFDAISVAHHTGRTVAAIGGKALPSYLVPDVLDLSRRSIVLLLDGDALSGALALKRKLETKRQVRLVPLPVDEDPASLGPRLKELL